MNQSILGLLSLFVVSTSFASTENQPAIAHPVGSCYGGGVVFYLNKAPNPPAGQRGLIAALDDVPDTQIPWDLSGGTAVVGTSAAYFSGQNNTVNILSTVNDVPNRGDKTWPAAQAASQYTTTETCPTCTPWYLPSQAELTTLYLESSNLKTFWTNPGCTGRAPKPTLYWSSTQYGSNVAWYVDFDSGRVLFYPTVGPFEVRSVRAF